LNPAPAITRQIAYGVETTIAHQLTPLLATA
jgi:hypothetical protein